MDRLIYTAVSGMNASLNQQRVIASNMANAQTTGFKAEILQATPMTLEGPQLDVRAMSSTEVKSASMKDGEINQTGYALDIAMQGDAMLAVQAPDGQESYSRRGDLSVTVTGVLQNGESLPVIGNNGPITVPPGSNVTIAPDGNVMITDPANPDQPAQAIDRIKLVSTTGTQIAKDLDGQFRVKGGGVLPVDENARVISGALEESNVNISEVLVQMISAQRLFDMRTKLVQTAGQLDEAGARLMRVDS
ncbi:flagellar basal body rod protein FlgF [Novosphingobium album (ex Hu et al. 2023)]|uniref:Flagellar basal-body rod protein FlgF n=1 Tax=Novosphingobium album (ex Hu et al. 2023) TaxID=2930093 RepID=A0ABT0AZK4_9SPHN|nr:flagellar basal body rod protein FlgF [Novosphingobium album (ex Hu et al. 2023)]MCJ2178241.1 flagellar basal body rod protein FlgF [Novosphingobium album (ex Hu et al. 2023)]